MNSGGMLLEFIVSGTTGNISSWNYGINLAGSKYVIIR